MSALELHTPQPTLPPAPPSTIDFFEARAGEVDAGVASVREGLAELGRRGLAEAAIQSAIELVRGVARSDMATAFSAWAHRMVIDYAAANPTGSAVRDHLAALRTAETLGVSALAAGTAHVLSGASLPVAYRADGDDLVLDGRIPWASNLIPPFLAVTAAADPDRPDRAIVVALTSDLAGIDVAPYPELLALGATGSSTVKLNAVRVPRELLIADDVHAFVQRVLPRFLLLQAAFCSGLADRALEEATANLGPMGDALADELERLRAETAEAEERSVRLAADVEAGRTIAVRDLLALRLRRSELATAAVHLELAATGGRGYLRSSGTARRVREAAFLPIQAPTEVMLRWLLSRSA